VVVRGGRYGRTGGRGKGVAAVGVAARGFKGDAPKSKGAGELPDFYRFQQVDRKKKGESFRKQAWSNLR
jgi:ribosomal RNA-processing protein 7